MNISHLLDFRQDHDDRDSTSHRRHTDLISHSMIESIEKRRFIEMCVGYLLSNATIADDAISSSDVASFFEYLCNVNKVPRCEGKRMHFYMLGIDIQFLFISYVSPSTIEMHNECIKSNQVENCGDGYGSIIVNAIDRGRVQNNDIVEEFCSHVYKYSTPYLRGEDEKDHTETPAVPSSAVPNTYQPSIAQPSPSPSFFPPSVLRSPSQYPIGNTIPKFEETPSPTIGSTSTPVSSIDPISTMTSQVEFTYVVQFDKTERQKDEISSKGDSMLSSMSDTIVNILTKSSRIVIKKTGDQQPYEGKGDSSMLLIPFHDTNQLVDHDVIRAVNCSEYSQEVADYSHFHHQQQLHPSTKDIPSFTSDCVLITSEVNVQTWTGRYKKHEIESYIYIPIKLSMMNGAFVHLIGSKKYVEQVYYVADGMLPTQIGLSPTPSPSNEGTNKGRNSITDDFRIGSGLFFLGIVIILVLLWWIFLRSRNPSTHNNKRQTGWQYHANFQNASLIDVMESGNMTDSPQDNPSLLWPSMLVQNSNNGCLDRASQVQC